MRTFVLVAALVVVPVLAGCLAGPKTTPTPTVPYVFVDPMSTDAGHDHLDRAQHQANSNVTLVGHLPLIDQEGDTAKSHSLELCDHWLVLGREREGQYGVDIVDVAD